MADCSAPPTCMRPARNRSGRSRRTAEPTACSHIWAPAACATPPRLHVPDGLDEGSFDSTRAQLLGPPHCASRCRNTRCRSHAPTHHPSTGMRSVYVGLRAGVCPRVLGIGPLDTRVDVRRAHESTRRELDRSRQALPACPPQAAVAGRDGSRSCRWRRRHPPRFEHQHLIKCRRHASADRGLHALDQAFAGTKGLRSPACSSSGSTSTMMRRSSS